MDVREAQRDVRRAYRCGFAGPLVSSMVWAAAAATYQWGSAGMAMTVLFVGGMFIFPLSSLVVKLMGSAGSLPAGHPSTSLALQSAMTVPLGLLVAIVLGSIEPSLFMAAGLIIVGAHYLTFISLYGMRTYGVVAGALVVVGAVALFGVPALRELSGWIGAAVLFVSAIPLFARYRAEFHALTSPSAVSAA